MLYKQAWGQRKTWSNLHKIRNETLPPRHPSQTWHVHTPMESAYRSKCTTPVFAVYVPSPCSNYRPHIPIRTRTALDSSVSVLSTPKERLTWQAITNCSQYNYAPRNARAMSKLEKSTLSWGVGTADAFKSGVFLGSSYFFSRLKWNEATNDDVSGCL